MTYLLLWNERSTNRRYAKEARRYVNSIVPHSTLREWRRQITSQAAIVLFLAVSFVLTLMGPFETGQTVRAVPRFGYWLVILLSTYSVGFFVSIFVNARMGALGAKWLGFGVTGLITGAAVSLVVIILNAVLLGFWPTPAQFPFVVGNTFAIAFAVAVVFAVLSADTNVPETIAPDPTQPPLLDRLPFEKRGALYALSVEDHYVKIYTSQGTHMLLMRLSDAIREVGQTKGLQVHRSHWVATAAIKSVQRRGDGAIIILTSDEAIPVSRRYIAALRDAGLLPKAAHG